MSASYILSVPFVITANVLDMKAQIKMPYVIV